MDKIGINVGSGGKASMAFVKNEILSRFSNASLDILADGANLGNGLVVTTDTFTVYPPFFDGGSIGSLAVCGMVNDLAAMGAAPCYMTLGLVIEEGFAREALCAILDDIRRLADGQGVQIVAGDTKIVERGKLDGIHIAVTGIGRRYFTYDLPRTDFADGDRLILTGTLGLHTIAVLKAKGTVGFDGSFDSDVAPLWPLVRALADGGVEAKFFRDVTRGGFAAVVNELAAFGRLHITVDEAAVPVNPQVAAVCDIYGFDIYSLACEGRMVVVTNADQAERAVSILRACDHGGDAAVVGTIRPAERPQVVLETAFGGKTVMDMPIGEILPRIC